MLKYVIKVTTWLWVERFNNQALYCVTFARWGGTGVLQNHKHCTRWRRISVRGPVMGHWHVILSKPERALTWFKFFLESSTSRHFPGKFEIFHNRQLVCIKRTACMVNKTWFGKWQSKTEVPSVGANSSLSFVFYSFKNKQALQTSVLMFEEVSKIKFRCVLKIAKE